MTTDPRAIARVLRELPPPSAEALAHSRRLGDVIRAAIDEAGGSLPFDRYMELALYAPGLGYYSAGSRKFGAQGDFVTAPELSPLFSRCLARQCAQVLRAVGGGDVLELGAGTGVMAADLLVELARIDCLPERYAILELSGELAQRQRNTIAQRVPGLLERVHWLERLPQAPVAVVLANEVLDAMPAVRFRVGEAALEAIHVQRSGDGFAETGAAPHPVLARRLEALRERYRLAPGYVSECNPAADGWVAALAQCVPSGAAFLIDYGFPGAEFYHPQRAAGTLMCHYRHRAHADPYRWPGLQDITAHVDFTAVAEAALAAGWHVAGFANQANFLLGSGLPELLQEPAADLRAEMERAAQVKRLTLPGEMGELFKVLALTRGIELPLIGFSLRDERGRL